MNKCCSRAAQASFAQDRAVNKFSRYSLERQSRFSASFNPERRSRSSRATPAAAQPLSAKHAARGDGKGAVCPERCSKLRDEEAGGKPHTSPTTFQGMLPPQRGPPKPSNPRQMPGLLPSKPPPNQGSTCPGRDDWKRSRRSPCLPRGLFPSFLPLVCNTREPWLSAVEGRKYSTNKVLYPFSSIYIFIKKKFLCIMYFSLQTRST